ncbi:MAG: hypothetical protein ABIQ60_09290, partial [Burkholderiaceae bacterium]
MVELLVGMAIALFITATGATLLAGNLRESRSLLLEARLMQDLRTAADMISRDLRRAGYWGSATSGVWGAGAIQIDANPYQGVSPTVASAAEVGFRYSRDAIENGLVDSNEQFGFRLRSGAIELQLGAGNWQALTDAGTMIVTGFDVTPSVQDIELQGFCPTDCPVGSTTCPPRQQVRSLALVISGRLASDARVTRSVRGNVRLRNDPVT